MDQFVKYWPIFLGMVGLIAAAVKVSLQLKIVLGDLEGMKPKVAALLGVPDRLQKLEEKIERMTPRVAEVRRLRRDFDTLDDDVGEMRDAMIRGGRPGPRSRRSRTPASGIPTLVDQEASDSKEGDE